MTDKSFELIGQEGSRYRIGPSGLTLGRSHSNQVVIPGDAVSDLHAQIFWSNNRIFIRNLSEMGVLKNGAIVQGESELFANDTLTIGNSNFWFVERDLDQTSRPYVPSYQRRPEMPASNHAPPPQAFSGQFYQPKQKKKRRIWPLVFIAGFSLVVILVGIFLTLSNIESGAPEGSFALTQAAQQVSAYASETSLASGVDGTSLSIPTSTAMPPSTIAPSGTIMPTLETAPASSILHVVSSGDTCEKIASAYGVSVQSLIDLNNLGSGCPLSIGQTLFIPQSTTVIEEGSYIYSECDRAAFVADVTIPDGFILRPGEQFTKTWRLRNTGDCPWTGDYSLVFFGDDSLGGPPSIPFTQDTIFPDQEVEVSVNLRAPSIPGNYNGKWNLINSDKELIPLEGFDSFWVNINVESFGERYFAEPTPSGVSGMTNPSPTYAYEPYVYVGESSGFETVRISTKYTRLYIINNSSWDICRIYIYPSNQSTPDHNYLQVPLNSYDHFIISRLPEGSYNLQAEACSSESGQNWGSVLVNMTLASLTDGNSGVSFPTWVIKDEMSDLQFHEWGFIGNSEGEVPIFVKSEYWPICYIKIWPSIEAEWDWDDPFYIAEDGEAEEWQTVDFWVTPGTYNLEALDCDENLLARANNVDLFQYNTWQVRPWDNESQLKDEGFAGSGWYGCVGDSFCEGYTYKSLIAEGTSDPIVTEFVPLPFHTNMEDVLPVCVIEEYWTSEQTKVGWKCGWEPKEGGYEFTLEVTRGAEYQDYWPRRFYYEARVGARAILLDKRYFNIVEVHPFQVFDDGEQLIEISTTSDVYPLFSVNVYETDKASKFSFEISRSANTFLVDVEKGNRGSYVQGAVILFRPVNNVSKICQDTLVVEESRYPSTWYPDVECPTKNDFQYPLLFTSMYSYLPHDDEDFEVNAQVDGAITYFGSYGNEDSYALFQVNRLELIMYK